VKPAQIELKSGPTSRQKQFLIRSLSADALRKKLALF
jgi:uncharacterized protein YggU (UPF0235/DUF167 family)